MLQKRPWPLSGLPANRRLAIALGTQIHFFGLPTIRQLEFTIDQPKNPNLILLGPAAKAASDVFLRLRRLLHSILYGKVNTNNLGFAGPVGGAGGAPRCAAASPGS